MGKLILKFNDQILEQFELKQGDTTIGRKPGNDVLIDNLAVSGSHASIFTVGDDSFIQDLDSTNGTFINNQRITKHHLVHGDVVLIGKHSLVYQNEHARKTDDFAKTVVINPQAAPKTPQGAALFILSGPNSGKRVDLTKSITQLGKTGKAAGTITQTPKGYVLKPAATGEVARLNAKAVRADGEELRNGDIIEVADTRMQFYLK